MTKQQWEAVDSSLVGLTADEKREVAYQIMRSIASEDRGVERARRQREALDRLRRTVDAMPTASPEDGLGNRDHDAVLYGR